MNIEGIKYRLLVGSNFINWLNRLLRLRNWIVRFKTKEVIAIAMRREGPIKVNIGCGGTRIDSSWLHADIHKGDIYLNALEKLPFKDNTIDIIFSEHFIEHLPEKKVRRLWKECYRTLKPGSWMRHSMPDLDFIIRLYRGEVENVNLDIFYDRIRHIRKETPHQCVYMNEILSLWGHQFNYDEEYLKTLWKETGFTNINRQTYGHSDNPELYGLEQHAKEPWFQNGFTLIMEAQKPIQTQ